MDLPKESIENLIDQIDAILLYSDKLEKKFSGEIAGAHPDFRKSGRNLLHYMALRKQDIRHIQERLSELGLSSLGRSEGRVKASLFAVRKLLCKLIGREEEIEEKGAITYLQSKKLLAQNTEALLGPQRDGRTVRIMVTLSKDAAEDVGLIRNLMLKGMDCARINCAHDSPEVWIKMINNIQLVKNETGLSCKILMDLAGIKLRTGALKKGPGILRVKTKRDFFGKLVGPAKIWLAPPGSTPPPGIDASIPIGEEWLKELEPGDKISFQDKRGKKRQLEVVACEKNGCHAELYKRSYIGSGTLLLLKDKKRNIPGERTGDFPALVQPIVLRKGDILIVHKAAVEGEAARYDDKGLIIEPAHISCTLPEIFDQVKPGEPILFNDGKIEGVINSVSQTMLVVKITNAKPEGSKLGADKGINLPESNLGLSGLTEKDRQDLAFIARYADIVNLSFVNSPEDIFSLQEELKNLNASHVGVMLKIETQRGFKNLPLLMLAAMKTHPVGVMIARGDLAVECGWERLAEIQEEILWMCEAGHVPVVWATQVLESLAKKGAPSRAEITDAAMSQRADCVMLNKGPYIIHAVEMLSEILGRMAEHQHKKTSMLRNLSITEVFNLGQ